MDPLIAAVAEGIKGLFAKADIALTLSVLFNFGLGWFIIRSRAEDRTDRKAFVDTLEKLTAALVELRVAFAAAGIKNTH